MLQFLIFAKRGTTEKLLIPAPKEAARYIMQNLNEKDGGNWLLVDALKPGEGILFSDTQKYLGFDGKIERYTDAIIVIPQP